MDYQKAYALLVGTMANAIDEIDKSYIHSQETQNAIQILKEGLRKVEEMYLCSEE